ncbi:MAG: hypothetical protein GY950_13580, partial [bacterium]|nr:hypothetical protein [bacterium]
KESWKAYDDFLLIGEKDRFAKLWARYDLFKMVVDIPGDIVECGVLQGTGALYWARMIEIFNPLSRRKVIGFDTFEGYPDTMKGEQDIKAGEAFIKKTNYSGSSPEGLMETAKSLGLNHRIELVKGDATITIKKYAMKNVGFRAALVNLDFDIYEPTLSALEALYDRVVPKGIIVFDEYAVHEWGESQAADEFFKDNNVVLKTFPWGFSPTAYMIK